MDFNGRKFGLKKTAVNISLVILLYTIILIENTISIGYKSSVPKSFALTIPNTGGPTHISNALSGDSLFNVPSLPFGNGPNIVNGIINPNISNNGKTLCSIINQPDLNATIPSFCNTINSIIGKDPTTTTSTITATNSRTLSHSDNLKKDIIIKNHEFLGSDRFRFIYSYWASEQGIRGSAHFNPILQDSVETDVNGGPNTLAVVLHYEGQVDLQGITAALKLPPGFEAILPLTNNPHRFDIAFSSDRTPISPGNMVVLYFPVTILKDTKVQTPYLGPLALHFLRADHKDTIHVIDADEQNQFDHALSLEDTHSKTATIQLPNSTNPISTFTTTLKSTDTDNFNNSYQSNKHFVGTDEKEKNGIYVNQVIPIIFQITGEETIDVSGGTTNASQLFPSEIIKANPFQKTPVTIFIKNYGDVPIYDLTVQVTKTADTGASNPSQSALVVLGQSTFSVGYLGPHSTKNITVSVLANLFKEG